jgi:pyruvate/2-oxoglutarate/acetoin dehydrogenase E1 component
VKVAFIYGEKLSSTLTKFFTGSNCYHVGFTNGVHFWDMHLIRRRRLWPAYPCSRVLLAECPVSITAEYLERKLDTDDSVYGWLDYLLFALQILSDDAATLQYRSAGGQKAPLIVRTRGHRLEGIWHSGSPMGMILHSLRGMLVLVPRNMVQAAGFYNTLMHCDEPALVVECLNGYRSKESKPTNLGEYTIPLGVAEVVRTGTDVTLVSYGSTFNICQQAAVVLAEEGIEVELVDARTLLPFDSTGICAKSIAKTNRLIIVDEDVSGGAGGYLLDAILKQGVFESLDAAPVTISAKPHLPAYGTDGDYFSKPNLEDIVEQVQALVQY